MEPEYMANFPVKENDIVMHNKIRAIVHDICPCGDKMNEVLICGKRLKATCKYDYNNYVSWTLKDITAINGKHFDYTDFIINLHKQKQKTIDKWN